MVGKKLLNRQAREELEENTYFFAPFAFFVVNGF